MTAPTLKLDYDLEQLWLKPGETITVYMAMDERAESYKRVELRVTSDGKPQAYVAGGVELKDFKDWEPDK